MSQHSIKSFSAALFEKSFYVAFLNIFIYFKSPLSVLVRYVFEVGNYPQKFSINTPLYFWIPVNPEVYFKLSAPIGQITL